MLNLSKVNSAIAKKYSEILAINEENKESLKIYTKSFEDFTKISSENFNEKIISSEREFRGALLCEESYNHIKEFKTFSNDEEIKTWKEKVLGNRICFAVDGSQIYPDRHNGFSFGAIQTAYFINYHNAELKSEKDIDFDILIPQDSYSEISDFNNEINFNRFKAEIEKFIEVIENISNKNYEKTPIGFFDGSFTFSFQKDPQLKQEYAALLEKLFKISELKNIPIIGYIDISLAYNLSNSLKTFFNIAEEHKISDSKLLKNFLKNWGDRSSFFNYIIKEKNINKIQKIGFCYLKNSSYKAYPCRIELPTWIYEKGLLDEIIEVILAESLIGNGYPYCIETADSIAVIKHYEQEFLQKYLNKHLDKYSLLNIQKSNKSISKSIRRRNQIKF